MGELKNYVSKLHNSTKRNYFERMQNEKVKCMDKAQNYGGDYWDPFFHYAGLDSIKYALVNSMTRHLLFFEYDIII